MGELYVLRYYDTCLPHYLFRCYIWINVRIRIRPRYGGAYSLCISYFFPVVRHIVPYLVGIGKMSFIRYSIFSFSTGFIWTLLFFTIGRFFGNHINVIGEKVQIYGLYSFPFLLLFMILLWITLRVRRKKSEYPVINRSTNYRDK
jgi:membrane protein DedA with SNARE-associated domain